MNLHPAVHVHCILEPEACVTDCWAQGSVPKQLVIPSRLATPCESIPEQQEEETAHEENTEYVGLLFFN